MMTFGNFWKFVGATIAAGAAATIAFLLVERVAGGGGIATLVMAVVWYVTCFAITANVLTPKA